MVTKKAEPENTAQAKLSVSKVKPTAVLGFTTQVAQSVQKAPDYPNQPDVQKAVTGWMTSANTVDKTSQALKAAHLTVVALIATLGQDMAAWKRAAMMLVAAINSASGGSASAIKQWGLATAARTLLAVTSDPPEGLHAEYDKQLDLTLRWTSVRENIGYLVQIGDGTPTGWGASIPCPKATYKPTGLTPGQKIAVRVAVQRRTGVSIWSDALSITVR
jgi:hypothetical protein